MSKHRQQTRSHRCDVCREDYKRFEHFKDILIRLSKTGGSSFAVYDLHRKKYILRNHEFYRTLGYVNGEVSEKDLPDLYRELIHKDDLAFVLNTEIRTLCFFKDLTPLEKRDYTLVYDFRVKNSSGMYMRFVHRVFVLEQDRCGEPWLLHISTELTEEKATNKKPHRDMIHTNTNTLHLFNSKANCNPDKLLTERETEILRLIAQGLESHQIAERLFISKNTVNNHRQNIIRKTNTKTTMQAVIFARRMGII